MHGGAKEGRTVGVFQRERGGVDEGRERAMMTIGAGSGGGWDVVRQLAKEQYVSEGGKKLL